MYLQEGTVPYQSCFNKAEILRAEQILLQLQPQQQNQQQEATCSLEFSLCPDIFYVEQLVSGTVTSCGHSGEIHFTLHTIHSLSIPLTRWGGGGWGG